MVLTHIFVNPQEQKYDAGTMYHQENFSTDFDCKIQCEKITFTMFMEHTLQIFLSSNVSSWGLMPPSNQSCVSACETQRIQSLDLGCNKICENITTSDDFIHLKEKGCNYHLLLFPSSNQKFFRTKIFFRRKKYFLAKNIFQTKKFFRWKTNFWNKFFLTKLFLVSKFFWN